MTVEHEPNERDTASAVEYTVPAGESFVIDGVALGSGIVGFMVDTAIDSTDDASASLSNGGDSSDDDPASQGVREGLLRARERQRIRLDGEDVVDDFEAYRPIAQFIASKYCRGENSRGNQFHDDVRQVADIALVYTIGKYDATKGAMNTILYHTVHGKIQNFFRDNTWTVRPSRRGREAYARVGQLDNIPSDREGRERYAEAHSLTMEELEHAFTTARIKDVFSLDMPINESGESLEIPSEEYGFEEAEMDTIIQKLYLIQPTTKGALLLLKMGFSYKEIEGMVGVKSRTLRERVERLSDLLSQQLQGSDDTGSDI